MFELKNKVALVTGAKGGMGRTHAILLARQGAKVVVTDRTDGSCVPVADEIKKAGGEAVAFKLDVTSKEDIDRVVSETVRLYGRLDILVNNAGIYASKNFFEMTEEDWDLTININLKGYFLCARRAAEEMAKNKWGRIINISSIASGQVGIGLSGGAHYAASKGGIIALTESLAVELAPYGILVNAIAPGGIDTPMANPKNVPKEKLDELMKDVPLKRMGRPEEISAAVVFFASDEAGYATGSTLTVDGGWLST